METALASLPAIKSSFASSAQLSDLISHIETVVAPAFLQEKGYCMLIIDAEGRKAFDEWQQRDRFNPLNQGTATLGSGFFGLRLPDTPEAIQEVTQILNVADNRRYIVVQRPACQGQALRFTALALA